MKMTQETDVLKGEKEDLLPLLQEMKDRVFQAAQDAEPVHQVEKWIWQQMLRIGRRALGQFFALQGTGDMGESITLPDGQCCQRLEDLHQRRYVSIFGEFVLWRMVYGSREGQKIEFVPLDNRLQLPASVFSYVLQDWDQSFCVEQAFGPSAQVIERILGFRQSVDSLEQMNADMSQCVVDYRETRPLPRPQEEGTLLVTTTDGKGIVMRRQETTTPVRRRKGEKANQKRMATVGAVYTVDRYVRTAEQVVAALFRDSPRPAERRPQPQHKHVWASLSVADGEQRISSVDIVYTWLQEEVDRRNPHRHKEMLHLSDGQESLWEARAQYLPKENGTNVLDILHVSERVWQAAHVFYPEGSDEAARFARERLLRILQGQSDRVVRGLREMGTKRGLKGAKRKTLNQVCAYFEKNRERMHYDVYLARGYPIASGVIEGACRHFVKDRMERAGMHWTPAGAQSMLDVRSVYVNGDWDSYQAYRIDQETRALYPNRELVTGVDYHMAC
jgi:hypothetical protein